MIAFIDESIRACPDGPRLYVVGVVVVDPGELHTARARARGLAAKGSQRFHWRNESSAVRRRMLEGVNELGYETIGYVHRFAPIEKAERARAICLRALAWDLRQAKTAELVIESRGAAADKVDRRHIAQFQKTGHCSKKMAYSHASPVTEPVVWISDAIAGAVGASIVDGPPDILAHLPNCVVRDVS